MKNIFFILLFIVFVLDTSTSFAQKIECETIEFSFYPNEMTPIEIFGLKVESLLKVDDLKNDTLVLKTEVKMGQFFGPKSLNVFLISKDGSQHLLKSWIDQSGDFQLLKILMPDRKKANIQIKYYVLGASLLYNENDDFAAYLQKRGEYYYPMDIPIREIKISTADSIKSFVDYKKEQKEIKDINLFFINKNKYNKKNISEGNLNINFYIPDSLVNDKKMQKKLIEMQLYTKKISNYLSVPKNTDVFFTNWRNDEARFAFGQAVGNYVLCDINFSGSDLLHELLHTLFEYNIEQNSKGKFFIGESIIEWLTLFLSNKSSYERVNNASDSINLYDAQINNHTTFNVIYATGPTIIQEIAAKCGEEKMAGIIVSFLQKKTNETTNYDEFISYVKKHLSTELGNEMDYLVKTLH